MKYAIVIAKAGNNYSAHVPDLPGCIATGATMEILLQNMKEAIEFHIEGMSLDGDPVPNPTTHFEYVEVNFPVHVK